jgi:hypothetical protein
MGAVDDPGEPAEAQFAPGCNLLVRPRPGCGMHTRLTGAAAGDAAPPGADAAAPAIPLHGGLGEPTHFETDLFVGVMQVCGAVRLPLLPPRVLVIE